MLDELRKQFLPEFAAGTRTRLRTAISLIPPMGPGGEDSAQSIAAMMHTIAGEAMLIGYSELAQLARAAGEAARRYLETKSEANLLGCARRLRALSRGIDALTHEPSAPPAASFAASATAATGDPVERLGILIVDDSPLNAALLREGLGREGFDTSSVGDDLPAILKHLESQRPAVLLVDWFMPGCDTRELCRQIQSLPTLSQPQVLLVTSLPEAEAAAHARALGIAGALSKEEGIAAIASRIRALVERCS